MEKLMSALNVLNDVTCQYYPCGTYILNALQFWSYNLKNDFTEQKRCWEKKEK